MPYVQRLRNFCFTLNNPTPDEEQAIKDFPYRYLVFGHEVSETGTPHLQGYVELLRQTAFSVIKDRFPRMHIEPRKSTAQNAANYCKKDGDFYEDGEISHQGVDHTLVRAAEEIVSGTISVEDVAVRDPAMYIRHHRGLAALHASTYTHRKTAPEVHWLWGPTGVGKTRIAYEHNPESVYIHDGTKWWDGYRQEEVVVLDDYETTSHPQGKALLRLLDRYPHRVQYKGGYYLFNSPVIYITTSWNPEEEYDQDEWSQILRRLTTLQYVPPNDEEA